VKIVQIASESTIEEDALIPVSPIGRARPIEAIPSIQIKSAQTETTTLTAGE
jgi:hypothetical protein